MGRWLCCLLDHDHDHRTILSQQSLSISLGKRRHRRLATSPASPVLGQPIRPLLQCRRRRLRPPPIQRALQRRRSLVRTLAMGEVRPSTESPHRRLVTPDRLLGFGACLVGACVCFFFAFLGLPWLPIRPAKFALAFRCVPPPSHPCLYSPTAQHGKSARHGRASLSSRTPTARD